MVVAIGSRPLTPGPAAVLVPSDEGAALWTFDRPLRAADIDRHRVLHQHPGQVAVAGPSLHGLVGDRKGELGVRARRTDEAEQGLDRAGDLHVHPELALRQLDHRIRQPLGPVAVVVLAHRPGQGFDRGPEGGAANRVENCVEEQAPVVCRAHAQVTVLGQVGLLKIPFGIARAELLIYIG